MVPDVGVLLLKLRDYTVWFGPAYILALAIRALLSIAGRRFRRGVPAGMLPPSSVDSARALWLRVLGQGLHPAALIVAATLSLPLLIARTGIILLAGSLIALTIAVLGDPLPRSQASAPAAPAPAVKPGQNTRRGGPPGQQSPLKSWWNLFQGYIDDEFNFALLGAVAGGLVIAWAPGGWLVELMGGNTMLAALAGALVGLALPLNGAAVVPLAAALLTRGAGAGALVALLTAAPLFNWRDLRLIARDQTTRNTLLYLAAGLLVAVVAGYLLSQLPASALLTGL